MVIFLAWMGAIVFSAESHATNLLLGERTIIEQPTGDEDALDAYTATPLW